MIEATIDAIDNAGAVMFFAFLMLGLYAITIVALLFLGLALHVVWRWLTRHTWADVIRSVQHKALR